MSSEILSSLIVKPGDVHVSFHLVSVPGYIIVV